MIRKIALALLLPAVFLMNVVSGCQSGWPPWGDGATPTPTSLVFIETLPLPPIKRPKVLEGDYDMDKLDYQLVWSDEFDYTGLPDPEKWGYDTGGHGWGNNELQLYTDSGNAIVADGRLVIEARKEEKDGMAYTSARLVTRNKGDWLYGKIEVRAKLPSGRGTWPAIWMLPTDWAYGDWPASGEIDIMEHVGYDPDNVLGSVHTQAYNHVKGTQKSGGLKVPGARDAYHIYAIEWLPDRIKFLIDGEPYFEFDPAAYKTTITAEQWPFDKPFHLLINIAVGGNWGGAKGVDDSIFPQTLEVDYVRVYQAAGAFGE